MWFPCATRLSHLLIYKNLRRRHVIASFPAILAGPSGLFAANVTRHISEFGVQPHADIDQAKNIQAAFDWLAATGATLVLSSAGTYQYSETLEIRGGTIIGNGASFIARDALKSCIYVRGDNISITDIRIISSAATRSQKYDAAGLMLVGASNFRVRGLFIKGVACGGLGVDRSHNGTISEVEVQSSLADGLHITNGSSHIIIDRYKCLNTGDDGFAVVTYDKRGSCGSVTRNIIARNLIIKSSSARGVALVGAENITIEGVTVENSSCAGIYMNSEYSYNTYGNRNILIAGLLLRGCVTRKGINQGCIHLQGRTQLREYSRFMSLEKYATRKVRIIGAVIESLGGAARAAVIAGNNIADVEIIGSVRSSELSKKVLIYDIKNPGQAGVRASISTM